MNKQINSLTAEYAKQIVSGLILMTVFTLIWTSIAYYGSGSSSYGWLLGIFLLPCVFFIYHIFRLGQTAKYLPSTGAVTNQDEVKKKEKRFMIICAAEGIGIFFAVNLVVNLHHPELQIPAIALVVGLHFFPLAKVFERKMDYYIGAWSTLIALSAIVLSLNHALGKMQVIIFTGVGLALATTVYGTTMTLKARRIPIG